MYDCGRSNRASCRDLIESGIVTCCEGIAQCRAGLDAVRGNNVARGTEQICSGRRICQRGLACCERGIINGGFQNRSTCSGLRQCKRALRDLNFGVCEIRSNNVNDGIEDVTESIKLFEESIEKIKSSIREIDNVTSSCQSAGFPGESDIRMPPFCSSCSVRR